MNSKAQRIGAWFGIVCVVLFFTAAVVLCRLLPPPISPTTTPKELVAFYGQNQASFSLGASFLMIAGAAFLPFVAAISVQVKKIEGSSSFLVFTMVMSSALVGMEIVLGGWMWAVLGFSSYSPDVTHAISNMAWIMFIWPNSVTMVMTGTLAYAVLSDSGAKTVFPRWVGYFNLLSTLIFIPSNFTVLFKSGVMAWNGVLPFWIPAVDFGVWLSVMFVALRKSIADEDKLPARAPGLARSTAEGAYRS